MDNIIQVPLNLPDVRVLSTQQTEQGHWLIRVESTLDGTRCRRCGREIRDLHGWDAAVHLRHLPLFDVPVFLEFGPNGIDARTARVTPRRRNGVNGTSRAAPTRMPTSSGPCGC
jgi:transposase